MGPRRKPGHGDRIPARLRGPVSGLLQSGYPSGYFVASLVYFLLFDRIGWRGMFMVGVAPALLVLLIRMHVKESPVFEARRGKAHVNPVTELLRHWKIALYLVVLMTAFNFFSHGTQDLYPTFLQKQHHFDTHTTGILTAIMNVGAIVGGIGFGIWSETDRAQARDHHRQPARAADHSALGVLLDAAAARRSAPSSMQVAVQGAWGIVPVHLNELSPPLARSLFPGFAYQLGNLIASKNAPIQAGIAESHGNNYALALALVCGITAVVIAIWTALGPERKDADFMADARLARIRDAKPSRLTSVCPGEDGRACRAIAEPPTGPDQAKAIAAVVAVHAALAFVILSGLNVRMVSAGGRAADDVQHREPPPPPPVQPPPKPAPKPQAMKKPEGAAAKKAEPTPVVAPPAASFRVPRRFPQRRSPAPARATTSGAAVAGTGTGAGGAGNGPGGGGYGDFRASRPRAAHQQHSRPANIARLPRPVFRAGSVGVSIRVNPDGSVVELPRLRDRAAIRRSTP